MLYASVENNVHNRQVKRNFVVIYVLNITRNNFHIFRHQYHGKGSKNGYGTRLEP